MRLLGWNRKEKKNKVEKENEVVTAIEIWKGDRNYQRFGTVFWHWPTQGTDMGREVQLKSIYLPESLLVTMCHFELRE